jgi:hypothetical protein
MRSGSFGLMLLRGDPQARGLLQLRALASKELLRLPTSYVGHMHLLEIHDASARQTNCLVANRKFERGFFERLPRRQC